METKAKKNSAVIKPTQPLTFNLKRFAALLFMYFSSLFCVYVSPGFIPSSVQLHVYYLWEPFIRLTSCSSPSSANSVFAFVRDFLRIILFFHLNKRGFETARCWWICWPRPASQDLSASVKQTSQREELSDPDLLCVRHCQTTFSQWSPDLHL